jgi:formate hydrogenlyase transcriptional activator
MINESKNLDTAPLLLKYRALLEVSQSLASHEELAGLFRKLSEKLHLVVNFELLILALYDSQKQVMRRFVLESEISEITDLPPELPAGKSLVGLVWETQKPYLVQRIEDATAFPPLVKALQNNNIRSAFVLPLTSLGRRLGAIGFASRLEGVYSEAQLEFLQPLANQVAVAIDNTLNFEQARAAELEAKRHSERERLMLEINNAVVSKLDLRELVRVVSSCLRQAMQLDISSVCLYNPEANEFRAYLFDQPDILPPVEEGTRIPVEGTIGGVSLMAGRPIFVKRTDINRAMAEFDKRWIEAGVRSGGSVPLVVGDRKLGILAVGSFREDAFSDADQELLGHIANQIAIAVENALFFDRAREAEKQAAEERDRANLLLEVNNAIISHHDLNQLVQMISASLLDILPHDSAGIALYDTERNHLREYANVAYQGYDAYPQGETFPLIGTAVGQVFTSGKPLLFRRPDAQQFPNDRIPLLTERTPRSACMVPLISRGRKLGVLGVGRFQEDSFSQANLDQLAEIAGQVAIAVENALAYNEIESLKNKLTSEKLYLEEEMQSEYNFTEIIGQSSALKSILRQLQTVAPTNSVVLIQGETGTGKELIARAIHNLSARRERTMVKINCAAIPTGLLESELFGHEKGAFTGAVAQRIGRFELANKGTLFLDEVGDIPLELQPKLLRVLQESEFERLGSSRTLRVDVRLVAATNCNLAEMVEEKNFRSDLYYRLNVFPLRIPPLRERREDIGLLVGYFIQKHARRMNKRIDSVQRKDMDALIEYHWPGNVRELENFIERAVILSTGVELEVPLTELKKQVPGLSGAQPATSASRLISLEDNERAHITGILRHTNGVIGGKGGAAEILGLPISTLRSRMKKLGLM